VTFFIFLLTIILVVFGASANPSSPVLFLSVMPLLVMPFYHLIFGIFGQRPLLVLSSIKHFRLRGVVAVVIGANVVLSLIGTKASSLLLATHTAIALLAMVNVFYFVALSRAKMSFYSIDREDSDRSPMAFFYYLSALLEFFLYCALLHHYVLIKLWALFGQETMSITLVFVSFIILYFCCFIFAKLFMIQRRAIGLDFFERGLLPISFMLFVVALLFEHY
ncbi:MAG TPA: hypothetical protein VEK06_02680, partial [Myxococcota bacterium]|nr:hypothetical protein [Myxococcota bacterium]